MPPRPVANPTPTHSIYAANPTRPSAPFQGPLRPARPTSNSPAWIRYGSVKLEKQIQQWPRYALVDLRNPNDVVTFAAQADFDRAVTATLASLKQQKGTQSAGQWADLYSDNELRGDSIRVTSGWGINDMRAVSRGCGLFGCAGDWNDVVSSVFVNGSVTLYNDPGYSGAWFWMGGYGWFNMSTYGYDNTFTSLNVWW